MKTIGKYFIGILMASIAFTACYDDEGNYNYLTQEQLESQLIKIDTTGMGGARFTFSHTYNIGDVISMSPKVQYEHPENLKYSWIVYPYPYSAVEVGNASVYPVPDTISHNLEINWKVDMNAGRYTCHLLVEDQERGLSASMKMGTYFTVNKSNKLKGVYILSEYDGQTDIEYYSSKLCLIYKGDNSIPNYYSKELGHGMLPGKPKFIYWGKDYYYVFTEENGYRLNFAGLQLMEEFNDMFYDVPNFNPQMMRYINNCEFLINDGKLHVLYVSKGNDRKFSAPISGDYTASAFLSNDTRASWWPTPGAIGADQIIFDEKNLKFRPYFPQDVEVGEFRPTIAEAYVDANHIPAKPIVIQGGNGGQTYAIVPVNGVPYLYRMQFYDVVDDGDLSADGANSIIDLSGCEDIMNLKFFCSNHNGTAFFYATDKKVYSFSPSSGQTTSNLIHTCNAGEEITCLSIFYHHGGGGFPTPGCALWLGVWEEGKKEGKLMEWEIDRNSGLFTSVWGPSYASEHENPYVTTGFGKIISIAAN